ncbi:hypothetical protein HDC94_000634 [Leifsonia sp. AK011]|uniref:M15 family metallopeptidase n=1 Tax=Leifsonia sp. AK011 TaxID=2723075 RepID=UPI0015CEE581|nr:M15 family metallopeptidase [Leifsonia sp. AK011]NYF09478.1 hypothetical protein [Leifsonia sp. AK011]
MQRRSTFQKTRARHSPGGIALVAIVSALAIVAVACGVLAYLSLPKSDAVTLPPIGEAPVGLVGEDDGVIPEMSGFTVDTDVQAIAKLDPELRAALAAATAAAAEDDQPIYINSGWRSTRYQQQLFDEAVVTYESEEIARQFVAPPDLSAHTRGQAVDIEPLDAQLWLQEHGYEFGLCQIFANERWHYELATTPGGTCPDMLTDASELGD